ncbi:hypothetical protein [Shuttleworthella sp. MSX8B]|nr:hypothetical protein [Shuttleworthia sp. MSX8B]
MDKNASKRKNLSQNIGNELLAAYNGSGEKCGLTHFYIIETR